MSQTTKRLTELRRQEQELRNYSSSSRWYTGTGNAIKYIELAETATTPADVFRNAWYAIYNLYMMIHKRGESENIALSDWIEEAKDSQKVRNIAMATPTGLFESLIKAQNSLLFDAESKKPREAKQLTEIWLLKRKQNKELSEEKACSYLLLIGRDLRNAISHPKQDPTSPVIKRALKLGGEIFLPLAIAVTEAMIEHPPEGTTGRATAYRSFLYPFLKNSDSPFSDYYLERLFPNQELDAFSEADAKATLKEIAKELDSRRADLVRADTKESLKDWCVPVLFTALGLTELGESKIIADDGVFEPTYVIKKADLQGPPRKEYKGKDAGRDLAGLIWVLPWRVSLDAISRDAQFEELTVMEVVQRSLTRADVDWAILTNGQQVRLLSKITAHKPRSFLELDLVTAIDRRNDRDAQLAFRYLLGLCSQNSFIQKDGEARTLLDRALRESERHGKEISDELKRNVFDALEELGVGFLEYMRANPADLEAWRHERAASISPKVYATSQELMTDIYHESLSLMYRLLFLFYAESRDLLPMDQDLYRDSYSLESIRDDIVSTHDDPDPKRFFSSGSTDLWGRLNELSVAVNEGWRNIIPAYNGGLFDPEQHQFLERFKVNDARLASAIDLLSRTRPGVAKGEGRKKVTYRDLEIRHLGSIYEGILEYHAAIADQEKAIVKRSTGGKVAEEYINVVDLTADERKHLRAYRDVLAEDKENPAIPRGCKVTGLKERGDYYLIFGGRESKRKSSGSYYTPDYIVQYIVENTLGPLVRGECRSKPAPISESLKGKPGFEEESDEVRPLTSNEILELKVVDPAMGSAHFLVAATEFLARAYGTACIRDGKDKDGVMSDDEFVHYKRIIAERCIYGVDVNPMAVELGKLSMWLFTMDKGRPLSFLNHNLKLGNALIGASIRELGTPPEFSSTGRLKGSARRDTKTGNLFEIRFKEKVPKMVSSLLTIMREETRDVSDIRRKKNTERVVEQIQQPFKNVGDIWVGLHFGLRADDYNSLLLNVEAARNRKVDSLSARPVFHWELNFPEVWFGSNGALLDEPGFSAIVGNPPYVRVELLDNSDKEFLKARFSTIVDRCDIYTGFVEQGINLLQKGGRLGFIVSGQFITSDYGQPLKALLESGNHLSSIIDLEPLQIFDGSTTYPILLLCEKSTASTLTAASAQTVTTTVPPIQKNEEIFSQMLASTKTVIASDLQQSPWLWAKSLSRTIPDQMSLDVKCRIKDISNVSSSLTTGKDSVLTAHLLGYERTHYRVILDGLEREVSPEVWRPFLRAAQISGWDHSAAKEVVFFPYKVINNQFVIITEANLKSTCLETFRFLSSHRKELEERRDSRKTWKELGRPWYSLHRIGRPSDYEAPRLLSAGEFSINRFALSKGQEFWPHARIIGISRPRLPVHALQLYLNSDEVLAYMWANFPPKRGGYRGMAVGDLEEIPCPSPDSAIWKKLEELGQTLTHKITTELENGLRQRVSALLHALDW